MPSIQELIHAFYQNTAGEQAAAVIEAVKRQETLLAAWFPGTKHYFITKELGQPCAVLFSERDIFERFALACKERGLHVAAIQNPVSERQELFADLWRCGFTRIMLDYQPLHLNLPLSAYFDIPDHSALPPAERPVLSPRMTGKILYLMQEIRTGRADGGQELDMLAELYHAEFLIPAMRHPDGRMQFPFQTTPDGKRLCMLFTDRTEWVKVIRNPELTPAIVRFADMQRLLKQGCHAILINPGSGAELMLDEQLLSAAEQAAAGDTSDLELHALREGEHIAVTEPDRIPAEMTERITACLQHHPEIKSAWLRMIHKDSTVLPGYLLILESTRETDMQPIYREIAEVVLPILEGRSLECASYDREATGEWVGTAKPFYRKKRFGFLK